MMHFTPFFQFALLLVIPGALVIPGLFIAVQQRFIGGKAPVRPDRGEVERQTPHSDARLGGCQTKTPVRRLSLTGPPVASHP